MCAQTDREKIHKMPLYLYPNIYESGSIPEGWEPDRGAVIKYPVRNRKVRQYLQGLLPGKWQKVIKNGNIGELHYFEHESGTTAGVKYFPHEDMP